MQVIGKEQLGLTKTERSKEYIDPQNPNLFTLEQLYKSIPYTVDCPFTYFCRLKAWLESGAEDPKTLQGLEEEFNNLEIVTFGSGGSCSPLA